MPGARRGPRAGRDGARSGRRVRRDHHACELFPERWFDLVLVLRVGTETLYDRLTARGYPEPKLQENLQCEIMQVVLEEAREAYAAEVVVELRNESEADLESMLARVAAWRDWGNDAARGTAI